MPTEVLVQFVILVLSLAMLLFAVRRLSARPSTTLRTKTRSAAAAAQSNRHFLRASSLLVRARSSPTHHSHRAQAPTLARAALAEAEAAISQSPKDAAPHVLKALALDSLGRRSSALRSLDLALSAPRARSLSGRERAEALARRAELKLGMGVGAAAAAGRGRRRRRRAESAAEDAREAVRAAPGEAPAWRVLGECCERKGLREEARRAFEEALRIEPGCDPARHGLDRLGSS
ncbi:uncharacterized protein LOC130135612 [Syzygium oleosum]|uniref:uncharacterized protein LOC130135612 n=1 Tax=Syzygium oleosum TaxID=219896 RepID=UPI0024BBC76B|nr:uncharacterized protein LOC130135612 [Syzygium oleosum]